MTEPQDRDRAELISDYHARPSSLARRLKKLFEPCTDANFAVLHNDVLDEITLMCGERVPEKDAMGIEQLSEFRVLLCKDKLAKSLAHTILRYVSA